MYNITDVKPENMFLHVETNDLNFEENLKSNREINYWPRRFAED